MTGLENAVLQKSIPAVKHAYIKIDLGAIAHNYSLLKKLAAPGACGAMVKANAYGMGQEKIISTLRSAGCKHFFFAYVEEAIAARAIDPDSHFYILSGVLTGTQPLLLQHKLIPCLISRAQVNRWSSFAQEIGEKLECILHVDTGLSREGLSMDGLKEFANEKSHILESLDVKYLMSHFANSNIPGHPKNAVQLERFNACAALFPKVPTSISNSASMFLGKNYIHDLTRPGMALYGYKSCPITGLQFQPALQAYARVLLVRTILQGETVGYDATHLCERETRVALLGVGHADGILRQASDRAYVVLHGYRCPVIGRISMDQMIIDITDAKPGLIKEDDWALLYGDYQSTHDFAQAEGTSVYELLVRHGSRYHRIYHDSRKN